MDNAIVIVVDRLGAGYLGPYGNTWIETPSCNRLAARSVLFEFALADAVDLATVYRSYWQGLHAMSPDRPIRSLPEMAAAPRSSRRAGDRRTATRRAARGGELCGSGPADSCAPLNGRRPRSSRRRWPSCSPRLPTGCSARPNRSCCGSTPAAWLESGTRPSSSAISSRTKTIHCRRIWSPRPSNDSARRSIRMKCWATCMPMRGKSRCWTTAWELSWRRPRRRRAGNGRCWP